MSSKTSFSRSCSCVFYRRKLPLTEGAIF